MTAHIEKTSRDQNHHQESSARTIRKLPILSTARWKCETLPALATSFAVRPKNVFAPVA